MADIKIQIINDLFKAGRVTIVDATIVNQQLLDDLLTQYSYYFTERFAYRNATGYCGLRRFHECSEGLNSVRWMLNKLGVTDTQLAEIEKTLM